MDTDKLKVEVKMTPALEEKLTRGMIPFVQGLIDYVAELEKRVERLEATAHAPVDVLAVVREKIRRDKERKT